MKTCPRCQQPKSLEAFGWKSKAKGIKQPYCFDCNREYQKGHYQSNKDTYKSKARVWDSDRKRELFLWLREYHQTHPCVDCGETDPVVLQFDHVTGVKTMGISTLVSTYKKPLHVVQIEIEKCVVRCANCHLRKTVKQLGWYKMMAQ